MSSSVMIVAGLELTRTVVTPSSRRARQAWGPEEANSAAWPMAIGPEPRMSTLVGFSVTLGLSFHVGHRPLPTQHHVEGVSGLSPLSEIGEGEAVAGGEVEDEHLRGLLGHAKPRA